MEQQNLFKGLYVDGEESTVPKVKYISPEGIDLLIEAQQGDKEAEFRLLSIIRDKYMRRRVYRYLGKNRQCEDDDIRQEFMIGVALSIHKAKLDMGDPIEYLLHQGVNRVRTYMRKFITQGTMQVCGDCGKKSRLNLISGQYMCKYCGSTNVTTHEVNDHNETALNSVEVKGFEDDLVEEMMLGDFKKTLTPGTNLYSLYELLEQGIDRDNPMVANYIKEIAKIWGGCSTNNVMLNIKKLQGRMSKWMDEQQSFSIA